MKITVPLILVIVGALAPNGQSQPLVVTNNGTIVAPPPARSFNNGTVVPPPRTYVPPPSTYVPPPQAMEIWFANGARVAIYREKFILIEPNGRQYTKRRPLPDLARHPYGCAWLRNYLDNTSPYTRDWGDHCQVYLKRCLGLR